MICPALPIAAHLGGDLDTRSEGRVPSLRVQPQVRQLQHQPKSLRLERRPPGNQRPARKGGAGKISPANTITFRAVISIRRYKQGWRVVIGHPNNGTILFAETRKPIAALPAAFRAPPIALMHDATYIQCPLRSGLGSEGQAILGKKFAVSEEGSRECTRKFALIMR